MCYNSSMKYIEENRKIEYILLCLVLALGFSVRLVSLDSLPLGLNQDEASAAYEAFALLNYGIDRNGMSLPVLFMSWGSGQNVLLSYLAMPIISVLGLSVFSFRLTMAVFSCLTLIVFYLLAKHIRGRNFALVAVFFLAINPWHIMATRWALESNLLPCFLLFGIYFTVISYEKQQHLILASIFLALSVYAYGTAFFFLPLYLILCVFWLKRPINKKYFLIALSVFTLIILPIFACQVLNVLDMDTVEIFGLTLPKLTEARQMSTSVFSGEGLSSAISNFTSSLAIIFNQTDGLPYNFSSSSGLYYFFGIPLFIIGIIKCIRDYKISELPLVFALISCFVCLFFIEPNINRINMIWLPLIYFMALGLYWLLEFLGKYAIFAVLAILFCFSIFFTNYTEDFSGDGSVYYYCGLGECIDYVEELKPESAGISTWVNMPYIFVLFYTEENPQVFIDTVDYINPSGAFRWVSSFSYWSFASAENLEAEYLILHKSEVADREIIFSAYDFVVCIN